MFNSGRSWLEVTTTATHGELLLPRDLVHLEFGPRDPARFYTMTYDYKAGQALGQAPGKKQLDNSSIPAGIPATQEPGYSSIQNGETLDVASTDVSPTSAPISPPLSILAPTTAAKPQAIKPILEVSCVDRARFLWNDFKVTWGPAWNDQAGCARLHHALDKRGLVTGYKCTQIADKEYDGFYMEARGHRPRFPHSLVADAIRETFEGVIPTFSLMRALGFVDWV